MDFIEAQKLQRKCFVTAPVLYESFLREHRFLKSSAPDEAQFRRALGFLEALGQVDHFRESDAVLLRSEYFHQYALALLEAARRDPQGMGRLPLEVARSGVGEQIALATTEIT